MSNSFVGAREREQVAYGFEDLVDEIVYSHEAGMSKPDPRVYALICARLDVRAQETVFLDDKDRCVDGAREASIHGIRYQDNAQAIEEIEKLLTGRPGADCRISSEARQGPELTMHVVSRSDGSRRLPGVTTQISEQIRTGTRAGGGLIFEPIPPAELQEIRAAGVDEAGNQLAVRADAAGGSPLRCCLRESVPGEQVLLIAYSPPGTRGAYAERGPVFIHAEPCRGYLTPDRYPPGLSHRQQVVRAYDQDGQIADGVVVSDGDHAMNVIRGLLARPHVTVVHLRNVGYGCYNFAVRRAEAHDRRRDSTDR